MAGDTPTPREEQYREILEEFVRDINDTGGVIKHRDGYVVPAADEDWIDLGTTYAKAYGVLGVPLRWAEDEDEETDEDEFDLQASVDEMARLEAEAAESGREMKKHLRDLGLDVPRAEEGGEGGGPAADQ